MSGNIQAGDRVMVIKATHCCGDESAIGGTFIVREIMSSEYVFRCDRCGARGVSSEPIANEWDDLWARLDRLQKIDPATHSASIPTAEEIAA